MKILSAIYGTLASPNVIDVTELMNGLISDDRLSIQASNENFTDPNNGVGKQLYVKYEFNDEVIESVFYENEFIELPLTNPEQHALPLNQQTNHNHVLVITSCNRIKQVLLALSINAQTIKIPFSVVIVDSSTPDVDVNTICDQLQGEDPYNKVKVSNFNSDVNLLYNAHKYFPNIIDFKVIHTRPRLEKQKGEANLVALGMMQAALIGDKISYPKNYCLKLTGTSILLHDVVSELKEKLEDNDVLTWHRTNIGGYERSTRIFGCKPDVMASLIAKEGWYNWCNDSIGTFEYKLSKIINDYIPDRINYTCMDDASVLLEGGSDLQWWAADSAREKILEFIQLNNIDTTKTPYLEEFMNGGIY